MLVIGGVGMLAYFLITAKRGAQVKPTDSAKPLAQAAPPQNPAPLATPQTTIVTGASSLLSDIKQATGVAGDLADVARQFGLFGTDETTTTSVATPAPAATAASASTDPFGFSLGPIF
jgi:hypothetical protein